MRKFFIPVANPTVDIQEAKAVFKQVKSGWNEIIKRRKDLSPEIKLAPDKPVYTRYAMATGNQLSLSMMRAAKAAMVLDFEEFQ